MQAPSRRALGAVLAVLGLALAALGAWTALKLGPSGEVHFSATSKATGAIVVEPGILNSLDLPVRIKATRGDGGAVWMAAAPSTDAGAVLAKSAVSTVSGVHFPAGTLDLRVSGAGALHDISAADIWRVSSKGAGSAELLVSQGGAPETAVVTSGDATALTNVTVTLTWAQKPWFFEALAMAVIGAIVAAFALIDVSNSRRTARWAHSVRTRRSRVRT
ncbi:MAG: hypothetical protein HHJ11_00365 [Phycicoccus sp.]|nr:hypothetical protein [Phycicoccus sp.]NMM33073.1 hypothetical protein [Phycicoccus sp.]